MINLGAGVIATMAALVLGLLVASAKGTYDAQKTEILDASAKIALIDRILTRYGPEASAARLELRAAFARALNRIWPSSGRANSQLDLESSHGEEVMDKIQDLTPSNAAQRLLKNEALSLAIDLGKARFLMYVQEQSSVSFPLLGMVVFWISINFVSFGLFAPRNATVVVALLLCAFAVSGAIFLILEMYKPLNGLIHVSGDPLRNVLEHLGK